MYYDLHIHSALSPCGDDTMTINNIFNMAYIKGLELIAITDHNSLKQQFYLEEIINHDILKGKIDYKSCRHQGSYLEQIEFLQNHLTVLQQ